MTTTKKIIIFMTLTLSSFAAILIFLHLPIQYPVYEQRADAITAFGEITQEHPFQQCFSAQTAQAQTAQAQTIQLFMATYKRRNTSHYVLNLSADPQQIAPSQQSGAGSSISHQTFSAVDVADNDFYTFRTPPLPNNFCIAVISKDAIAGNAITIWLNSMNLPVIKVLKTDTLPHVLPEVMAHNLFPFGTIGVSALFFGYLLVQIFFASLLFVFGYEKRESPSSEHSSRAD